MTPTSAKHVRSVAGAALLGIGAFLLRENFDLAAGRLHHVLGLGEGAGLTTTIIVVAMRGGQAYACDRLQLLHDTLLLALAWCRPVLLIAGSISLSRDIFADGCDPAQDPGCGNVELPRQFGNVQ